MVLFGLVSQAFLRLHLSGESALRKLSQIEEVFKELPVHESQTSAAKLRRREHLWGDF